MITTIATSCFAMTPLLADAGLSLVLAISLIVLLVILGITGLLIKVAFKVLELLLSIVRWILSPILPARRPHTSGNARNPNSTGHGTYSSTETAVRICRNRKCAHRNRAEAVFCSRCGRKL